MPNAANADKYIEILKEKAILRSLISAGSSISSLGYEVAEDVETLIDKAQNITSSLGDTAISSLVKLPVLNVFCPICAIAEISLLTSDSELISREKN